MEHEISLEALKKKLQDAPAGEGLDTFCLLDVREPWEASLGAIEGSRLIPMGDLPSRAHQELDPDAHIVVYCHHGARSLSATMWLREQGFSQAQSLAGGIDAWSCKIDPAIPRY
jgi:rhodanese-related sulfurtransferase